MKDISALIRFDSSIKRSETKTESEICSGDIFESGELLHDEAADSANEMSISSSNDSNRDSMKKHSIVSHGDYSSPTKRSRPSLSQRLGLTDDSDQSDAEPYSPSDENFADDEQRIIRQPQASLRESTLIATGQHSKSVLELLQDVDEDDEDEDEQVNLCLKKFECL